jgi:hypothetical protein
MRLRPLGPGIGGLYYSPLLKNARAVRPTLDRAQPLPPAQPPLTMNGRLRSFTRSLGDWAKRFGQRLIEARMAQAEAQIARSKALFDADGQLARNRAIGVRYY